VKYGTAEAFRAALDQRIRNEATTTGLPVMRLRKRVAFERFLARLAIAEPGSWVLKGAFALELRLGVRTRMTKDIDLAGAEDEQTATARLIAAQAIDLHDHFNFDVARTAALDQAEAFRAVRYSVTTEVAGRRFEQFPVDVALNEQPTAPSERLPIPSLLDFADIQPIEMPVIALEQHIAEKVHAYTATYGPQEQHSTRIKDLIDILLIADLAAPQRRPPTREPHHDVQHPRTPATPHRASAAASVVGKALHERRSRCRATSRPRDSTRRGRHVPRRDPRRHHDRPLDPHAEALDHFLTSDHRLPLPSRAGRPTAHQKSRTD
jgi:predicted nucleotidyltransferase component of viral defense system